MNNTFEKLSAIDVSKHVEKKNGLDYLSWAFAWKMAATMYPNIQRVIYEREDGRIYWDDGRTAWVKVGVVIDGIEHVDYLPIMNHANKSIGVDNITSFDVNKAIQRSTVKALALHGLGINIYSGEENAPASSDTKEQKKDEKIALAINDANWQKVIKYAKANKKLGIEKLVEQLSKKYLIDSFVATEIEKEINN